MKRVCEALLIALLLIFSLLSHTGVNADSVTHRGVPNLIAWTNSTPTIDGRISAGEWDNAKTFNMNYNQYQAKAHMMNNETTFFMMVEVFADAIDGKSDREFIEINIDGDNDDTITYTDSNGASDNNAEYKPVTLCGPCVDRWARMFGNGTAEAGWLNLDGTKNPKKAILWALINGSVNNASGEPYDFIATGFYNGHRIYEYSIPIMKELNTTMGATVGIKVECADFKNYAVVVGTLPQNTFTTDFPYDTSLSYFKITFNQKPMINISSPKHLDIYPTNKTIVFDASNTKDRVHGTSTLKYEWDFGDNTAHAYTSKTTHSYPQKGIYNVSVKVTNSEGIVNESSISIIIDNAPVFISYSPKSDVTVYEGDTITFCATASDPDGDPIEYKWYLNGVLMSEFTNKTSFRYTPDYLSAGKYIINVTACDGILTTLHTWNLTVRNANAPPDITNIEPSDNNITMYEGSSRKFRVIAMDIDKDTLTHKWYVNDKKVNEEFGLSSQYTYYADYTSAGNVIVKCVVSDYGKATEVSWNITVINVNRKPYIIKKIPEYDPIIKEGEEVDLKVVVVDDDEDDILIYTWHIDDVTLNHNMSNYTYRASYEDSGTHDITVDVYDSYGMKVSHTWYVSVDDVNRPPEIIEYHPKGDVIIEEGKSMRFEANFTDPDGDVCTIKWFVNGGFVLGNTREYLFETDYESAGEYRISAKVSDGDEEVEILWNVTVKNVNRNPHIKITSPREMEYYVNEEIEFDAGMSYDDDEEALTFRWESSIDGIIGEAASFKRKLSEGKHAITLIVSDSSGGKNITTFEIIVKKPKKPLLVLSNVIIEKKEFKVGEKVEIIAIVENMGSEEAESVTILFLVEGKVIDTKKIATIYGESEASTMGIWYAKEGNYTIEVKISESKRYDVEGGGMIKHIKVTKISVEDDEPLGKVVGDDKRYFYLILFVIVVIVACAVFIYTYKKRKKSRDEILDMRYEDVGYGVSTEPQAPALGPGATYDDYQSQEYHAIQQDAQYTSYEQYESTDTSRSRKESSETYSSRERTTDNIVCSICGENLINDKCPYCRYEKEIRDVSKIIENMEKEGYDVKNMIELRSSAWIMLSTKKYDEIENTLKEIRKEASGLKEKYQTLKKRIENINIDEYMTTSIIIRRYEDAVKYLEKKNFERCSEEMSRLEHAIKTLKTEKSMRDKKSMGTESESVGRKDEVEWKIKEAENLIDIMEKDGYDVSNAKGMMKLANSFWSKGDVDKALKYVNKARDVLKSIKKSDKMHAS